MAVQKKHTQDIHFGDLEASEGISVFSEQFDEAFYYDGSDLGAVYTKNRTVFRLWAPTAWEALVVLYNSWQGKPERRLAMERKERGTWVLPVEGDLEGKFYTYQVRIGDRWNEAADPYARAVGVNGDRGCIIDLAKTNPNGWTAAKPPFEDPVDAVIYEIHVRDLSVHPQSGIKHKGKYLGVCEKGTKGPQGVPTGLDHIVGLGVTHVQLMPVFDYSTQTADETRQITSQYNWGYDPKNYNVPEGSYSTDPYDPPVRITELKRMIQTLHDHGLRVIMDVVYNHVYDGYRANLAKLVPGYYLRYTKDNKLSDGSCCGNDTASERKMMRKFIIDSLLYWVNEYHIDGFRFDLMGLHDVETMREIRRRLDEADRSILLLGEGWVMETELPKRQCANQRGAARMPRIGHFNDCMRDALKGEMFENKLARGFVSGAPGLEAGIKKCVAGGIPFNTRLRLFARQPSQTVNYAECHDNYTLWDKLELSVKEEPEALRRSMHRLASAIVLTSQGIPFLHAGQEFMRTKNGVENSYQSPDRINRLDWKRCAEHREDVEYMQHLIALRKKHPAFRLRTAAQIKAHLHFERVAKPGVAFTLRNHAGGDPRLHLYVLYNPKPAGLSVKLPDLGIWVPEFGESLIGSLKGNRLAVNGIGMVVLAVK